TGLAGRNPAYQPRLATTLTTAAQLATAVGAVTAATAQARQAVQILRQLTATGLDRHGRDLAAALLCLSRCLAPAAGRVRQLAAAVEGARLAREAVECCRRLAAGNREAHEADLATALANLGTRYAALGRQARAVAVTQEALAIRRRLAGGDQPR